MTVKVLFMQSQEFVGPDSRIEASLMARLPRDRFEVHCASTAPRGGLTSPPALVVEGIDDVHVRSTNFGPSLDNPRRRVLADIVRSGPSAAVSLAGLVRYVRTHRIDIVQATEKPRDAFWGTTVARLGGARSLLHIHVKPATWMRGFVRRAMHRADALVGVSQFVADSLVELGYDTTKVHAVLNGLELDDWLDTDDAVAAEDPSAADPVAAEDPAAVVDAVAVRREFGAVADAPLLVSASRLFRWKGQHLVLEALPAVKDRHPDVLLLVVGADDTRADGGSSYSAELRRLVERLDLADNVVFTGWRSDVRRLIGAADIFVMPSFEEPFGMVYLEAMSLRRPVVALDNGGAREVVDHGGSGLLSPPDDVPALAANIARLIADPGLRRRMGAHGRQRVIDEFSSQRMADDMAAVYERVMAS